MKQGTVETSYKTHCGTTGAFCNAASLTVLHLPPFNQVTVEALALEYYASEAGGRWRGLHCEGGVWATLFGLLM
jgi:hypothetical protein